MSGGSKLTSFTTNFSSYVALGRVPGFQGQNKFGANFSVGSTQEDVWSVGGTEVYLSSAETMDIVSTAAADNLTGTGAQKIHIFGLDNDYNVISEEVDLQGLTPVTTTNSYLRVYRAFVIQAGSGTTNAGDITITASTAATTHAEILTGRDQTLKTQFTVPNGKYLLMNSLELGTLRGDEAECVIAFRPLGGVFRNKRIYNIFQADIEYFYSPPLIFTPKTDIVIRATDTGAGGISVTAAYDFYIVDEALYNANNQFSG